MPPRYRYPLRITASILGSFLLGGNRSLASDAPRLLRGADRFVVRGNVPRAGGPHLFLINHYSAPGFKAWWLAIALTAAAGRELHWPMTAAWTFPDPLRAWLLTPLTERVLARLARMYSFTSMPPMPPRPPDAAARADAVRRILRLARTTRPDMALAPEGMDSPDGRLAPPPAGAGRFIAHLAAAGYALVPVGAFEEGDAFVLRFGEPFGLGDTGADTRARRCLAPAHRASQTSADRDRETGRIVMEKIANLTPFPAPGISRGRGEG
jgi:hypothetical protein